MSPQSLFDSIQTRDSRIVDQAVYVNDVPVGVVVPSTLASLRAQEQSYLYGPRGIAAFDAADADEVWATLIATGGILFGTPDEVANVQRLLRNDRASRTASYFCAISKDCAGVVKAVEKIRSSCVAVVGAGGIGSLTAMVLAGAGVGRLKLVDPDVVEASNFNRQFFYGRKDIGSRKIDALTQALRERYEDIDIEASDLRASAENAAFILDDANAVVVSADEPLGISLVMFKAARERRIDAVGCGYVLGRAGVQFQSHRPSLVEADQSDMQWSRLPSSVMPSFGPTNVELAGLASSMTLLSLCDLLDSGGPELQAKWMTTQFPRLWSIES